MASAFWGGFAGTVLDEMKSADDKKDALDTYAAKKGIDQEYETTDIEDVDQAGNPVIRKINGKGKVVGERRLTQSEVENRKMKKDEALARLQSAQGEASLNTNKAKDYESDKKAAAEDRALGRQIQMSNLRVNEENSASLRQSRADSATNQRLALEDHKRSLDEHNQANSAQTFAATKMHDLTDRLSQQPVLGAQTTNNKKNILIKANADIQAVLDSKKPDPEKKRIIQTLIDGYFVYLPEYTAAKPDAGATGSF